MPRPTRKPETPATNGHSILAQVPSIDALESTLAGMELEAGRVRTLLAAVKQMSGSRQPLADYSPVDDLAMLEESA